MRWFEELSNFRKDAFELRNLNHFVSNRIARLTDSQLSNERSIENLNLENLETIVQTVRIIPKGPA